MKGQKLEYVFYNPNPVEKTAEHLLSIFVEANEEKVKKAIKNHLNEERNEEKNSNDRSA